MEACLERGAGGGVSGIDGLDRAQDAESPVVGVAPRHEDTAVRDGAPGGLAG